MNKKLHLSPTQQLENLMDALCEDILSLTDEEVMEEYLEGGGTLDDLERWANETREYIANFPHEGKRPTPDTGAVQQGD